VAKTHLQLWRPVSKLCAKSCVLFLVFVGGCSTTPVPSPDSGLRQVLALTDRFGEVHDPELIGYLTAITERIRTSDPRCGGKFAAFSIVVLDTPVPIALSSQGGFIIVSRGLIAGLQNEGQLAFILGHEMSHHILGQLESNEDSAPLAVDGYLDREQPADRLGLACISRAGYDPRPALSTVSILAQQLESHGGQLQIKRSELEMVAEARSRAMYEYLVDSKWRPPGTVDRRNFQIIRRRLASMPQKR